MSASEKHPVWTRSRVGRNRVLWVAYDDRPGAEGRQVVARDYASSLAEADAAARSALAEAGMYQARRASTGFGPPARGGRGEAQRPPRATDPGRARPREYLYTRRHDPEAEEGDGLLVAAHLVLKKTPKKVYVTRRSCGPDQICTVDENWAENEPVIALDRIKLERDGSAYSSGHRLSDFYASRDQAMGDLGRPGSAAFGLLGLRTPCTVEDIKAAYRRKALEVHPDRGGSPGEFQAVEAVYRRLLREAQVAES